MNRAYVVLALMILAAMFCLGVIVLNKPADAATLVADTCPIGTVSESDYRMKFANRSPAYLTVQGDAVIKALKAINANRANMSPPKEPWNGQKFLIAMLSTGNIGLALIDNGCVVPKSDFIVAPPTFFAVVVNMGWSPDDLVPEKKDGA